jgi:16S rRNA U1498 N3-methylase RsmE
LEMGVSRIICLGWSRTVNLPISAFQITMITGLSQSGRARISDVRGHVSQWEPFLRSKPGLHVPHGPQI